MAESEQVDLLREVICDLMSCPRTRTDDRVQFASIPVALVARAHEALYLTGGVEVIEVDP